MSGGKVKGRSNEEIAKGVLEELGYRIIETNKMVSFQGAEAFEVDIIAEDSDGDRYCVEVKSGETGVSDIRHVFANAEVLGIKPLLVSKGFTNEAAKALADELDVNLIKLSEFYLLLEPEELEVIIKTAVRDVLNEYGFYPLPSIEDLSENDLSVLQVLATSENYQEAEDKIGLESRRLGKKLGEMRARGILPSTSQSFIELKRHFQQIMTRFSIQDRLDDIVNRLKTIEKFMENP